MAGSSIQVFEYLLALKNITVPIVREFEDYKDVYWWQKELPVDEGCLLSPDTKSSEAWLEVYRQGSSPITEELSSMPIQGLYGDLFALYQRLQREGDSIELVWGHGLLVWNLNGTQVCRPVFTTRLELLFDSKKGLFTLSPTSSGTTFELDMLNNNELPDPAHILGMERFIQDAGINPWDEVSIKPFLKELIESLSPEGKVIDELMSGRDVSAMPYPTIYNAPIIFVRSMSGRQWHTELQAVIEAIRNEHYVPESIEALVSMDLSSHWGPRQEQERLEWQGISDDILFPLPANEEQKDILCKLSKNIGVVVQGPPGTGKSHTIVNLIAHLLAHGKRVLITSQTERALRVLGEMIRTKLPDIAPLCVSVMGGDARSVQELELSVTKISEGLDQVNVDTIAIEIARLRQDLSECKEKIAKFKSELGRASQAENLKVHFAEQDLSPLELAEWLATNQLEYGWFPDELDESMELPLSDGEMIKLYKLLQELNKEDINQVMQKRPELENLPSVEEILSLKNRLSELENELSIHKENIKGWAFSNKANSKAPEALQIIENAVEALTLFSNEWLIRLLDDIVYGENRTHYWQRLIIDCKAKIRGIRDLEHRLAEVSFKLPTHFDLRQVRVDAELLRAELLGNQKPSFMFKMFNGKKTLYLLEEVMMNGSTLRTADDLSLLLHYITMIEAQTRLVLKWNHSISIVNGPLLEATDPSMTQTIEKNIEFIHSAFNWKAEHLTLLVQVAEDSHPCGGKEWTKLSWLQSFAQGIISRAQLVEYNVLHQEFEKFSIVLKNGLGLENPHSSWGKLYDAYRLGDGDMWQEILLELRKLQALEHKVYEMLEFRNALNEYAPRFVAQIESAVLAPTHSQPPTTWRGAWEWKRADVWLRKHFIKVRLEQLYEGLNKARNQEARLIQTIVSKSTWLEQNQRTTEVQRRSLRSWAQTIRKIGKGTGKYAAKHQADAKKEMAVCRGAVPVWIMPLNRVIENFKPSEEAFDVVIVDESSQSDLFALSALFRGKRAIVVGDDRQISPEAVGKDQGEVNELIDRYLLDVPQRERFTLQDSLYDTALRIFPGQQIMLKEHFRSVPEIIQFSNEEFYGGIIEPLRVPTSDRLMPPIATVRVDGYRDEGSVAVNQPEALALVTKIIELCSKDEYGNKTMGVISLQGKDQAYIIEQQLREKLGESEMFDRKIICGDAYSFQGDERDVIFISMVAAPNVRSGVLNKSTDEQRFNVAASRAREQLWLFHSVDVDDLHPTCMRYRLLKYCQKPQKNQWKLRTAIESFEKYGSSQFHQDVYQMIIERGYQAIPEFKVGTHPYRIGIVVEGTNTRLAVECDGDAWHGLERWEEELDRQRVLERVGWKFWRIRGSYFYREREKALEPLWATLAAMGIEPQTKQ
ncbi:AAA domain-containing protein [Pelosinus sp. sgz500959]|uniref:AAA domain-containing protein n=1 Tax=Pelosinus sp. sgz500959 TaxID=3242472 RepID=UPI0036733F3F